MAFIREFGALSGDPFSLRLPKKLRGRLKLPKAIRKFQPGKALGKLASIAAPMIPGVGQALSFARGYGVDPMTMAAPAPEPEVFMDEGPAYVEDDPLQRLLELLGIGDPGGAPKRKRAAAGPKAKAQVKATKRATATAHTAGPKPKLVKPSQKGSKPGGIDWTQARDRMNEELLRGNLTGAIAARLGVGARKALGIGGGGHRRRINPLNPKALRRSARRLEGFQKEVKRIEKLLPRAARHGMHGGAPARRHKAGCRCATCK